MTKLSLIEEDTNEMSDETFQKIQASWSLLGLDLSSVQSEGFVAKHHSVPADIVVRETEIA